MTAPSMRAIQLNYNGAIKSLNVPASRLLAELTPRPVEVVENPQAEVRRALQNPIEAQMLSLAARGALRVVIAADDMTRLTPVELIIPALLDELNQAGVSDEQITVLVALGTHRPMTSEELLKHFGENVVRRVRVANNPWQDPAQMVELGTTENGTPIYISRMALESDFLIGVGSIVPHHIPGYSGGAKIVQPGLTGAATTGATHYLSTRTRRSYLGQVENPVRNEMEQIAHRVGLKAIFNVVLDASGRLVQAFYGQFVAAHRAGVKISQEVYGLEVPGQAEVVLANAFPCEIEFWQAHKALYPADMAVIPGGVIVVHAACPEGVAVMHPEILQFTALPPKEIEDRIEDGRIADVVSGALALAWAKVRQNASVYLVSEGISDGDARALGFIPFPTLEVALEAAFRRMGETARLTVLTHAPDTLPLIAR
jgi:nickel-dependent lactate racemase